MNKVVFHIAFIFFCVLNSNGQSDSVLTFVNDSLQPLPREVILSANEHSYYIEGISEIDLQIEVNNPFGKPVSGIPVRFELSNEKEFQLSRHIAETDSSGKIQLKVSGNFKEGLQELICYVSNDNFEASPLIVSLNIWSSNWLFALIVGLLGGLSLFLFGMSMMSSGMQSSAGDQMRNILNRLSNNRFVAVGVGALITSVIQSSSATNVMLVSFVNSRLMRFRQTIGIILGAAIGTTITAQIIAFKLTDYALVFVIFGLAIHYTSKRQKISEIGRAVLGFGILFFGLHIMSESMYPLRSYEPLISLILKLEYPLLGIIVGAIFTALIQSSSAFIGILIILAMQGLLSVDAAMSLTIGANIGTAITAILASINTTREARQVAFAHTFIKLFGAVVFISVLPLIDSFILNTSTEEIQIASPRFIANAHTIYNIVLCAAFLPFTNLLSKLVERIYPSKEEVPEALKTKFIDNNLLTAPSIALRAAREELLRLMQEVELMAEQIIIPFKTKDLKCINEIKRREQTVNFLRDQISDFLVQISRRNVGGKEVEETFILLNAVREFEQIADIISTPLLQKAESWSTHKYEFSEAGLAELQHYHQLTIGIIKKSIKVYKTLDLSKAQKLKEKYYEYRQEYFDLERQHYDRLKENIHQTISSSKTHLEIITLFRVISSHATNTARIIILKTGKNPN
ncbi:MAG: Na/Pi symporter [Bacteroidales bacterium]|nr:Na/Pi symporter [Bacteroidales bacterium]MBN2817665.1 Na/Pi symporter [Bacteroidales bacterium]